MIPKVLVVEDDFALQKYLKEFLQQNDYSVTTVSDGVAALNTINKLPPDIIILDLGLPTMSGETVIIEARKKHPDLPIIVLTAKDSPSDVIQGLELGADDYMSKPFVATELLARIRVQLRGKSNNNRSLMKVGDLELDSEKLEVKRKGKLIQLTPQEFKLLQYLMTNQGRILTREMILNRVWLYSPDIETRVVDVYMGYLRKKIDNGFDQKLIHSIRGFGYTIKE
ncbi:MAG: response regulator transcription factor [Candidatus Daviesbacteria bacterium]|nr:MAG: response regulator transcription factor [Candidatus Daviesbacteria bacterium]